jgi:hypothetical protein
MSTPDFGTYKACLWESRIVVSHKHAQIYTKFPLRWISCGSLQKTSKWTSGKDYLLCEVPLWFKPCRSHFVIWNVLNINYTVQKKKVKVNKSRFLSTTSKWSSGKDYLLCDVPLWFKPYRRHFVTWNVLNINYTVQKKKVMVNKLRSVSATSKWSSGKDYTLC